VWGPEGEERIAARTKVWAAGVQASPLAKMLAEATGAATDRAGRVAVLPDCTLPGRPEVFAIGDMVSLNGLPGVAQPAMQEGRCVAKVIRARLAGTDSVPPFKYFDKGSMATIGHRAAVADAFGMTFTGVVGYLMWGFIHVLYLIGWGQSVRHAVQWLRSLTFTNHRAERIITVEQAPDEVTPGAWCTGSRREPETSAVGKHLVIWRSTACRGQSNQWPSSGVDSWERVSRNRPPLRAFPS